MAAASSSSSRSHQWPPGFRFRPTDQELVGFYLTRKVSGRPIQAGVITEVDLYKCEPWDLPDKSPFQNDVEWYFFCARDKKYPNGSRTNRATEAGYWKATGKDRVVRSGSKGIGMKKTLVFYKGRAPHGQRTEWIMHEYRLEAAGKPQQQQQQHFQDSYVLCRVFKKGAVLKSEEESLPSYLDEDFACPSPSSTPAAAAEPEEGQVCSPSPAEAVHDTVAASVPDDNSDDSLNAFLAMLLEEPSLEQAQMHALGNAQQRDDLAENAGYGSLLDEPQTLEQLLQQQAEEGNGVLQNVENPQIVGDELSVMDMLNGDFIELDDLLPSGAQQSYEQLDSLIDWPKYLESEIVPSATKVAYDGVVDQGLIMPSSQAVQGEETTDLVVEGDQRRLKRFLGMLGSIHVLPASAAEYPGSTFKKVKEQLRTTTAECSAIHMNVAVTFACSCLSKKKTTTASLDRAAKGSTTKRRSNLFFVFLVGSVSALFWILLLPALSRLSSYVHAALL